MALRFLDEEEDQMMQMTPSFGQTFKQAAQSFVFNFWPKVLVKAAHEVAKLYWENLDEWGGQFAFDLLEIMIKDVQNYGIDNTIGNRNWWFHNLPAEVCNDLRSKMEEDGSCSLNPPANALWRFLCRKSQQQTQQGAPCGLSRAQQGAPCQCVVS